MITEEEIVQTFLDLNYITKWSNKVDKNGKDLYVLSEGKLFASKKVAKELEVNPNTLISHYWPKNIRLPVTCSKGCKTCKKKTKLVGSINLRFQTNFNVSCAENEYLSDNEIKNMTIRDKQTGRRRKLNKKLQKEFKNCQECLKILDHHTFDKNKSDELWREILVDNKIRDDTIVVMIDGMGSVEVGDGANLRGLKGKKCQIIPIGIVFCFSCPITGETKRISRVLIPDSNMHNTWQFKQCVMKLFNKNDPELFSIFENRNRLIVNFYF